VHVYYRRMRESLWEVGLEALEPTLVLAMTAARRENRRSSGVTSERAHRFRRDACSSTIITMTDQVAAKRILNGEFWCGFVNEETMLITLRAHQARGSQEQGVCCFALAVDIQADSLCARIARIAEILTLNGLVSGKLVLTM
jgi:hypothetical protein